MLSPHSFQTENIRRLQTASEPFSLIIKNKSINQYASNIIYLIKHNNRFVYIVFTRY